MGIDPGSLRLYVITSGAFAGRGHDDVAAAALEGGATALQLRAPELADDALLPIALRVAARCRNAGVPLVINDRFDVARTCGADGVHVGQDVPIGEARARSGEERILGVSVRDVGEARAAEAAGADYVGVTVWPSATKPEASARGLDAVREISTAVRVPVVGIGGIGAANAGEVLGAGAAGVAVISAVATADDPVAAVRDLRRTVDAMFTNERPRRD
jgi:thiamine-phosphate pyrophosphorylase